MSPNSQTACNKVTNVRQWSPIPSTPSLLLRASCPVATPLSARLSFPSRPPRNHYVVFPPPPSTLNPSRLHQGQQRGQHLSALPTTGGGQRCKAGSSLLFVRPTSPDMVLRLVPPPICFPLLFPHGEPGYTNASKSGMSPDEYAMSRLMMPEKLGRDFMTARAPYGSNRTGLMY